MCCLACLSIFLLFISFLSLIFFRSYITGDEKVFFTVLPTAGAFRTFQYLTYKFSFAHSGGAAPELRWIPVMYLMQYAQALIFFNRDCLSA